MKKFNFTKMHALGNDFMLVNNINYKYIFTNDDIIKLANRNLGVGFDQLLVVQKDNSANIDFNYRIFNADGSEVSQCGNGARCFAKFVVAQGLTDKKQIVVSTNSGILKLTINDDDTVSVDMGNVIFNPSDIPFISNKQQLTYNLQSYDMGICSLGNPHCTIIVADVDITDVAKIGQKLMFDEHFPEQVNVGFMQIVNNNEIKLRVYERGAAETLACGSGACAAVVYGMRLGLIKDEILVNLRGGTLQIKYHNNKVFMRGEAVFVYDGNISI